MERLEKVAVSSCISWCSQWHVCRQSWTIMASSYLPYWFGTRSAERLWWRLGRWVELPAAAATGSPKPGWTGRLPPLVLDKGSRSIIAFGRRPVPFLYFSLGKFISSRVKNEYTKMETTTMWNHLHKAAPIFFLFKKRIAADNQTLHESWRLAGY